jgi:hypothetical protein
MTCRDEVLAAARRLAAANPDGCFTIDDVVQAMARVGTRYPASTIRTHVSSRMCVNAPAHHATRYPDLVRDSHGRYRLNAPGSPQTGQDHAPTALKPPLQAPQLLIATEPPAADERSGDSRVQRDAEHIILAALSRDLGVALAPRRMHLPGGAYIDVEGASAEPPSLVEEWAHQGPPKVAQKHKVLADALKLLYAAEQLGQGHRRILCLCDPLAAAPFTTARTWYAAALRAHRIEVIVVDLPEPWPDLIRQAQTRQYR